MKIARVCGFIRNTPLRHAEKSVLSRLLTQG
jgi:hypothetical protein